MRKAVFLDRDGVINAAIVKDGKPFAPLSVLDLRIEPSTKQALDKLRKVGYLLVVVTNQPEIARGNLTHTELNLIHEQIVRILGKIEFYICEHDDADKCECRKPKPGLIFEASNKLNIDISKSFLIGDRWRDIEAGQSAGCQSIWLDRDYSEREPSGSFVTKLNLWDAVEFILNEKMK